MISPLPIEGPGNGDTGIPVISTHTERYGIFFANNERVVKGCRTIET